MQYRADFISNLIASIGWVNFNLLVITLLGNISGGFGGWSPDQMLLLAGVWMINNGIGHFFWYRNIKQIIEDIHKGTLDFWMTKPVDVQFLISFRRVILNALVGVVEGIIVILIAINRMGVLPGIADILGFVVLITSALAIYYSLWFIAATATIHFELADNLFSAVPSMIWFGKFPDSSFPTPLMMLFVSILPILVLTSFPSKVLMGTLGIDGFLYGASIGITMLYISRKFWFWSLKKYTSAN